MLMRDLSYAHGRGPGVWKDTDHPLVKELGPVKCRIFYEGWSGSDACESRTMLIGTPVTIEVTSGTHLTQGVHARDMFTGGGWYTTAVDVWGVGYLIREWNSRLQTTNVWTASNSRLQFLRQLLSCDPTNFVA